MNRRVLLKYISALSAFTVFTSFAKASNITPYSTAVKDKKLPFDVKNPAKQTIAILIFPDVYMLDLIGPHTVFSEAGCKVDLIWKDYLPIQTDLGIPLTATKTFNDYELIPDVLLIPGGEGTRLYMNDPLVLDFVRAKGEQARWVTSVCTGSLILGGAGLLKGYKATSHWAVKNLLPLMGAIVTEGRVVVDRNRITGGGVTAGIDFGLILLEKLQGREAAEFVELVIEYAPDPPFKTGSPDLLESERIKAEAEKIKASIQDTVEAVERARQRLKL